MTPASTVTGSVRIYIDGQPVDAERGVTPLDALSRHDAALAAQVSAGERIIVDHRGLPVSPDERVTNGSILRVVSSRQAT